MIISSHGFLEAVLQGKDECAHSTHEKAEPRGQGETTLGDTARDQGWGQGQRWGQGYSPGGSFQGSILAKPQMDKRTRAESSPVLHPHPLDGESTLQQDHECPGYLSSEFSGLAGSDYSKCSASDS